MDSATNEQINQIKRNIKQINPQVKIIEADSVISVDRPEIIKNKRVLVVEDGPTLTHGGMKIGAGTVAAERFGASEIVDPRPYLVGKLKETFEIYPEIGNILPAMGYSKEQREDLEKTIEHAECDAVIIGTPIDLNEVIKINKPNTRVGYELKERNNTNLTEWIDEYLGVEA
jgi:predicted GTPase